MKRKRKIQLAAEALAFIMLISSCQKTLKLIKEVRNSNPTNKVAKEMEDPHQETIVLQATTETMESLVEEPAITEPEIQILEEIIETIPTEIAAIIETNFTETSLPMEEIPSLPCIEEEPNQTTVAYTTTNVNMRSSNTTDALRINNLQVNEKVYIILSCENNWDIVKYNNQIGYICRDYLNYSDEKVDSKYKYTPHKDIALTKEGLNFRPTPSTEVKSISRFGKDDEIEVVAEVDNGWYLIKNNGILGYVHGDYIISLLDRANEQYQELGLTELETQKVVWTKTGINIRNGAGEEYDEIGNLEKYETVRVMKEYDDWYFVMTNNYNFGFINKEYTEDLTDKFIVIDISEQRLWIYNNSELYYTTPVTTGKDSTPSHIGKTEVNSKENPKWLSGSDYKDQPVEYWVGINDYEEGIHDASWRPLFGKEVNYHLYGSHGCHNTPLETMAGIYNEISIGDTAIVHK